jgi:hypothetical protein
LRCGDRSHHSEARIDAESIAGLLISPLAVRGLVYGFQTGLACFETSLWIAIFEISSNRRGVKLVAGIVTVVQLSKLGSAQVDQNVDVEQSYEDGWGWFSL